MSRAIIVAPDAEDQVIIAVRDAVDHLWEHIAKLTDLQFTRCINGLNLILEPYHCAHAAAARSDIMGLVAKYEPKRDGTNRMQPWTAPMKVAAE